MIVSSSKNIPMVDLSKFVDKKVKVTFKTKSKAVGVIKSRVDHLYNFRYDDPIYKTIYGICKDGESGGSYAYSIVNIEEFDKIQELEEKVNELQKELTALRLEESKTEIEKAYKEAYGNYPGTADEISELDAIRWEAFEKGWNAA
jgi:hypothetical protein